MTGAAITSAATGVGGLLKGSSAGEESGKSSDMEAAMAIMRYQFNQEQLDDWENQFGGLQDNLTDYYNNLDADKFATQGKEQLQASMEKQMIQFNESMAAQGLQSSGMRVQAEKEAAFSLAQGNAQIDLAAPEQVNQMKQGYLQSVSGRRDAAIGGINNSLGGMQEMYGGQAQQQGATQAGWMDMAGSALGAGIGFGVDAYDSYTSTNFGKGGAWDFDSDVF